MLAIFVGGASASGKTEFAKKLVSELNALDDPSFKAMELPMDHYYKSKKDRGAVSFDEIAAFDMELLGKQLRQLEAGEAIERPVYLMGKISDRSSETVRIDPTGVQVIVIEGILALTDIKQLGLKDVLTVFVYANSYLDYVQRRIGRDEQQRDTSAEETRSRELKGGVRDAFFSNIASTRFKADIEICNDGTESQKAEANISNAVARVLPKIKERVQPSNEAPGWTFN